jgi:acyl-CoA reductase-like NAD-dependent aldehyde dehydrogenase
MEASAPAVSPPESAPELAPLEVRDPATGELIRRVPSLAAAAVAALVADALAAQPGWEALGFRGRAAVFHAAQKWLIDNSARMVDTICAESGKARDDAQVEISVSAQSFGFWAKMAPKYLADEKLRSRSPFALGRKVLIRYSPIGVIGVIGPWNYPLVNVFLDAVPALMAGNSVVLKPSEVTPLTALLIAEMMDASGIPEGVLQVATGARETGEAVIDECDFVMFTGSTRTGSVVMERAARTLTPVSLELGGKDPLIVCADADVDRAANAAAYYSMNNSGQICISVERVYVEEPVYDEFVSKVVGVVDGLRQGPPAGPGEVDVGAITHGPQLEIVERHVNDAREHGGHDRRRRPPPPGRRAFLRADGADGRRPHDGLHDRGDVRPDASDHEGAPLRRGDQARQRFSLRTPGERLHAEHGERRANRAPPAGRRGDDQRFAGQLHGLRRADGRLERGRSCSRRLRPSAISTCSRTARGARS